MKKAFSLLELIFAIIILGIIASVAVPKFIDTKNAALSSTIKRDISSVIVSVQNYSLLNNNISKISDAITLSSSNWTISDTKIVFKDNGKDCISMELKDEDSSKILDLKIDASTGNVCNKLSTNEGITSDKYILY